MPIRAKKLSLAKRLERFLDNEAVDVETWYHPWASWLLESAGSGGVIHMVVDTTKVSAYCRQLMIAVAYQRRTLPIIWDWVDYPRGHCTAAFQVSLLKRLKPMLPPGGKISFVGDSEFGNVEVIKLLNEWGWDYALRQKGRTLFCQAHDDKWMRIDSFSLKRGQCVWLGHISLTQRHACETHLVIYWKKGEKEPWYLATNQLSGLPTIRGRLSNNLRIDSSAFERNCFSRSSRLWGIRHPFLLMSYFMSFSHSDEMHPLRNVRIATNYLNIAIIFSYPRSIVHIGFNTSCS